ncbi:MAG: 1-acyl-sn-glycerol-3-phosphate acyltransferase [Symploca sp. SIO2C1]|nr:1-acyl-sn-glycerol-3-phosphate acyltransferase [Symploca sp. SIO2C1]
MNHTREPLVNLLLYHLLKSVVVSPLFRFHLQGQVYGEQHVPQEGPVVIVCNHASDYDPLILACCVNRPVAYMAKAELFNVPVLKELIQLYGAYPVKRASLDRKAIRVGQGMLSQGWAIGIFVQGTFTADGRITEPKLGAAFLAAKHQVPLLPVCLWGTQALMTGGHVLQDGKLNLKMPPSVPISVRIGQPLAPPSSVRKEELWNITQNCTTIINELHSLGR